MKLGGRDAAAYLARPDPARAGLLLYGEDAMRVALKRQQAVAALLGPGGEEEMRLTRIAAADLRKDPALLSDAMRATGFFPGPRVVLLEDAGDGLRDIVAAALDDWRPGDATVVVTAGSLGRTSRLRKLFEDGRTAVAIGIYDDPPGRDEIEAMLRAAGLGEVGRDAMAEITALSRALDPGDFRQTVEKLALYAFGQTAPVSAEDVAAVAPASVEAGTDELIDAVAESRAPALAPVLRRLEAQGVNPVGLCIAATRHFRTLYAVATDPAGAGAAIGRARPPVPFKRRDRLQRQAEDWRVERLEQALSILVETDLTLRSSTRAPQMALMERTLIRLAMLNARR